MANLNRYHRTCRLQDPVVTRVKIDGRNWYQVWQDEALIDQYKSRPPANRLVKELEALNVGS